MSCLCPDIPAEHLASSLHTSVQMPWHRKIDMSQAAASWLGVKRLVTLSNEEVRTSRTSARLLLEPIKSAWCARGGTLLISPLSATFRAEVMSRDVEDFDLHMEEGLLLGPSSIHDVASSHIGFIQEFMMVSRLLALTF